MDQYEVDILPGEVLGWVRDDAGRKTPRLGVRVSKEYWVDTEHTREISRIGEEDIAPVIARGVMEISPQGKRVGWTLQVSAEDSVAVRSASEDEKYMDESDMTVDAFESEFLIPERGEVEIVVLADDVRAWQRFQRWLARRRSPRS